MDPRRTIQNFNQQKNPALYLRVGILNMSVLKFGFVRRSSNNLYYNSPYGLCPSPHLTSVAFIFGLYRPSSGPIALRNVLKCSTWHTFFTIRFWRFNSTDFIEKTQKTQFYAVFAFSPVGVATGTRSAADEFAIKWISNLISKWISN